MEIWILAMLEDRLFTLWRWKLFLNCIFRISTEWRSEAYNFVKDLFGRSKEIYVRSSGEPVCSYVLGDVYVRLSSLKHCKSVGKLLCTEKYAVMSEQHFSDESKSFFFAILTNLNKFRQVCLSFNALAQKQCFLYLGFSLLEWKFLFQRWQKNILLWISKLSQRQMRLTLFNFIFENILTFFLF